MSEHQKKPAGLIVGRFNPDNGDLAFANFRDTSSLLAGHWLLRNNGKNRHERQNAGKTTNKPRINEAKRALRESRAVL